MSEQTSYQIVEQKKLSRQDIAFCLVAPADTSTVYFGSSDASVYCTDLSEEKPEPVSFSGEYQHTSYVTGMALTSSGKLVSGSYDRRLIWWDAATRESNFEIPHAHSKWIRTQP